MAWISVHESIDGPKLRNLYKILGCSKFEAVGILNFLWFWGLSNAEKDGLILFADKDDVERYLYGAGAGCSIAPKDIVEALIESGWIDQTQEGMRIHNWTIWQEQWYKAKEKRESDRIRKRESRKQKLPDSAEAALPDVKKPDEPKPKKEAVEEKEPAKPKAPEPAKYSAGFEEFWKAYPRKIDKGNAYKKYRARRNDGYSDSELLLAAKNYAAQCIKFRTEPEYIKHPKTFLSDSTPFVDYLPKNTDPKPAEELPDMRNPFAEYGGKGEHE